MRNSTKIDPRQQMLEVNFRQKDFYESRYEATLVKRQATERAANLPTNIWTWFRYRLMDLGSTMNVYEQAYTLHREWMSDLKDARVLDLGCFAGNKLSLWMAENCADYTGIDLSEQATAYLDEQLRARHLVHARAYKQDFLANSFPDNHFDLVYAHAVLHHFKDMTVLLEELQRILKPGGVVISFDPMMTEPLNRFARLLYRPLQTDREWEWPFSRATFRLISKYFEYVNVQGFMGMVKLGFPFQLIPVLRGVGRALSRWGLAFDKEHARQFSLPFYLCWVTTLQLRKPEQQ